MELLDLDMTGTGLKGIMPKSKPQELTEATLQLKPRTVKYLNAIMKRFKRPEPNWTQERGAFANALIEDYMNEKAIKKARRYAGEKISPKAENKEEKKKRSIFSK